MNYDCSILEAAEDKQQTEVPPRAITSAESTPPAITPGSTENAVDNLQQPMPPVVPSTSTDPTQTVQELQHLLWLHPNPRKHLGLYRQLQHLLRLLPSSTNQQRLHHKLDCQHQQL